MYKQKEIIITTFTTEDRIIAEKDGSFTINVEPIPFAGMVNLTEYKDLQFPGFQMRFTKQGDEWVCKMPDWLMDLAVIMANGLSSKK